MSALKSEIEKIIQSHVSNEFIIGYSFLEGLIPEKFEPLNYGITIGIKLDDRIIDKITRGPTAEYEEHYNEVNCSLNRIAQDVKKMLEKLGCKAEMIKATLEFDEEEEYPNYYETLSVEFPHKTAATRSGLGWIGKTALLVSPEFGPRVRLVTVLTDRELNTGQPIKSSLCGDCKICVEKCPAQAANGKSWSVDMSREDFYDAFKCRSTAKELAKHHLGKDESICGICIAVCPIGKSRSESR